MGAVDIFFIIGLLYGILCIGGGNGGVDFDLVGKEECGTRGFLEIYTDITVIGGFF